MGNKQILQQALLQQRNNLHIKKKELLVLCLSDVSRLSTTQQEINNTSGIQTAVLSQKKIKTAAIQIQNQ